MKKLKETYIKIKGNGCLGMLLFFVSVAVIFVLLKVLIFKG
jgi:hypothetical protein